MSSNQIAFFIGLFGSVHCIGMCGPLAFSVPVNNNKWWLIVSDKLLYNAGRVLSYTFLGWLIGFAGRQLWVAGMQQGVSLLSGGLIILAGLQRLLKFHFKQSKALETLTLPITRVLNYALKHHAGHLTIGILNGFLPCGFVYLALAGAVNAYAPAKAAQYMFWFGMGTFPLMLLATVSSGFIGAAVRRRINKTMPYFMVCLGIWFVLRGLNLAIPYLSPPKPTAGVSICH